MKEAEQLKPMGVSPPIILLRSPSSPNDVAEEETNLCGRRLNDDNDRDEHMLQLTEPQDHLHHHHHGGHVHHHHHHHHHHHLHDRGCVRWPCGLSNFSVSLIVGMIGFSIFWLVLLLRIYLPDEYWISVIDKTSNATNVVAANNATNVAAANNASIVVGPVSNVTNIVESVDNVTLARNVTT